VQLANIVLEGNNYKKNASRRYDSCSPLFIQRMIQKNDSAPLKVKVFMVDYLQQNEGPRLQILA